MAGVQFRDYYQTLGLKKGATEKEIRSAYRKLARELHPDLNPNNKDAEKRFKEVNEAYEVLSDADKRKKYDQLGSNWRQYEQWQRAGGAASGQPFDWSDLFGGAPGTGRNRAGRGPGTRSPGSGTPGRGTPGGGTTGGARTVTPEELEEMFGGGGPGAGGAGSPFSDFFQTFFGGGRTTARPRTSSTVGGRDVDQPVDITIEEAFTGTTRLIQVSDDRGASKRLEVKIPAGVREGARVRVAGQGGPGVLGGPPGDLYLVVHVTPSPLFGRDGDDLQVKVPVRLTTAVLGGEIEVPTPKGSKLALKIPAGTQDGRRFRLRGQGMPRPDRAGERGDLLAEVHVQLPEALSDKQRALFEELAKLEA